MISRSTSELSVGENYGGNYGGELRKRRRAVSLSKPGAAEVEATLGTLVAPKLNFRR